MSQPRHDDGPRIEAGTSTETVATATGVADSCAERPHPTTPPSLRQVAWSQLWDRLLAVPGERHAA
jgi:hypothetical protein